MSGPILSHIRLQNFKCHTKFDEDLERLTIFAGSNAAGKSSIIQSILIGNDAWHNADRKRMRTNDIYGINLGLPSAIISEEHDSENTKIDIEVKGKNNVVELELPQNNEDLYFKIINYEDIVAEWGENNDLKNINLYYINAERFGPRITSNILDEQEYYVGSRGENTTYVISKVDLEEKTNPELRIAEKLKISHITRFSANCEAWLDLIVPGTKLKINTNLEMNISTVKYQNEGEFYLPTATGFGISYVLPIITQALIASMQEKSVLIVENPEAHLHPYSQSMMGKFLAFVALQGVQVIIETHSEHIINGCRLQAAKCGNCSDMKIIFFTKDNNVSQHKNIKINDNGELEEWPKGFFDQTQVDLRELLELRRCKKQE